MKIRNAKFNIGDVVRHRNLPLRGVVFDVDAEFSRSEDWYRSLPDEMRPDRDQPFYYLVAENDENSYQAYVAEDSLETDGSGQPLNNPQVVENFTPNDHGGFTPRNCLSH